MMAFRRLFSCTMKRFLFTKAPAEGATTASAAKKSKLAAAFELTQPLQPATSSSRSAHQQGQHTQQTARKAQHQEQQQQQQQLPSSLKHNALTDLGAGSIVGYWPRYLAHASKRLLPTLLADVPWEQRSVNIFNRSVPQPRLICYMADDGLQYTYSGLTLQPHPWSAGVNCTLAAQ
jgi:hypothetical protein